MAGMKERNQVSALRDGIETNCPLYAAFHEWVHCTGTTRIAFLDVFYAVDAEVSISDDHPARLNLMRHESQDHEASLVNQPRPCVCIPNDLYNPCEAGISPVPILKKDN